MRTLCGMLLPALLVLGCSAQAAEAQRTFVTIGTGAVNGVYYPVGLAICRLVNKEREAHGIYCSVENTPGSIYNLNNIRSGELQMGLAQSDWQYHALHGSSQFQRKGPFKGLRALFSVHPEPYTVVARRDSGIGHIEDLKGKRVNIGDRGSGQRGTTEVVMDAFGWSRRDFKLAAERPAREQVEDLCNDLFDAMVYVVGHPSIAIDEATSACDSVLVDVGGRAIDGLVADNPYYAMATIPGGMYSGNPDPVSTFGVRATVVTSEAIPEDVIYNVVKAVFEDFEEFKSTHPALAHLDKQQMVRESLTAPLHPGALRYYREAGLL